MPEFQRKGFVDASRTIVENAGFDPEYYFVEDKAGDVPHYFYSTDAAKPKDMIYVEEGFSKPRIREISEVSAAVRGLQTGYRIHRICFPGQVKPKIAKLYRS